MSSIGAVCNSLRKNSLFSLVGYFWTTDRLWVNLSLVKGEFIILPLFFLEENAKLQMRARADCVLLVHLVHYFFTDRFNKKEIKKIF